MNHKHVHQQYTRAKKVFLTKIDEAKAKLELIRIRKSIEHSKLCHEFSLAREKERNKK